ncbi:MAG: cytidine deaminase [Candidatus Aenigmarchaeota archaeon]|nr:cytidine deaminase [Candidatus Aenigmarchaeota archaeon]
MINIKYEELPDVEKKLLNEAEKAMETAYGPYSKFYVGAALLTNDGTIITGSNFENSAYGSTICAERGVILRANAMGYKKHKEIAIIGRGEDFDTEEVIAPCGSCRQVLYEVSQISDYNMKIILSTTKKEKIIITSINELLPLAFRPKDLRIDIKK